MHITAGNSGSSKMYYQYLRTNLEIIFRLQAMFFVILIVMMKFDVD